MRQPAVYIMASARNGTIYVGVTSDLVRRNYEHRTNAIAGSTSRYGCKHLVYFDLASSLSDWGTQFSDQRLESLHVELHPVQP